MGEDTSTFGAGGGGRKFFGVIRGWMSEIKKILGVGGGV